MPVLLLLLSFNVFAAAKGELGQENQTLRAEEEVQKLKIIRSHLKRINKPAVRTIQVLTDAAETPKCCQMFYFFSHFLFCSIFYTWAWS